MWFHVDSDGNTVYYAMDKDGSSAEPLSGVNSNFKMGDVDEFAMGIKKDNNWWAFHHIKDVTYRYKLSHNINWYNKKAIKTIFEGIRR